MHVLSTGKFLLLFSLIGLFVFATPPTKIRQDNQDFVYYSIDTTKSKLHWDCSLHKGNLNFLNGYLTFNGKELVDAELVVDMNSITNTDIDNKLLQGTLENVLKSIEFFRTEDYPEARFKLHSAIKTGNNDYSLSGDFIIFERDICTDFECNISISNDSLYISTGPIILDRSNWGIFYLSRNNLYPKEG
ncbi:MAG: YceI family protein, partial [Bacteroidota bacterium]